MLRAGELTLTGRISAISLALEPGRVTAICGPNGAGKSSLLMALAGLLTPDHGSVLLDQSLVAELTSSERARSIGYLPQSPDLAWDVSVETLVGLGRLPWRSGRAADLAAVEAALLQMDLSDLRQRQVSKLSGGERARALTARVLAGEPRWILADEPLANLDLSHQRALLAQLRAQARRGIGVVLVMHDLGHAMNHADRVVVLNAGAVAADGTPEVALDPAVIGQVWQVRAQWLGSAGARALAILP